MMPELIAAHIRTGLVVLLVIAALPTAVRAEGTRLRLMADVEYLYSDIDTEDNETGEKTNSIYSYFRQKYNLDFFRELYPYLEFRAGGLFELIDSSTKTDDSDSGYKQQSTWLFSELNLNNPLYTGGLSYRRREFEFDPDSLPATTVHREEYTGLFRWTPVGLPLFNFDYSRYRTWDDDESRDLLTNRYVLKSRYSYQDLSYDYTYTRFDSDERLRDYGELNQLHDGGIRYSHSFFGDRLVASGGVKLKYQTVEPRNEGSIEQPATPRGTEFYLLDDNDASTLQAVDAANPLTAVNIGQNAPPGTPVAVGLDFGMPTDVDTLHVVPLEDAQDPLLASPGQIAAVANMFEWTVFSSDDQVTWNPHIVSGATYDVFENRFEISFTPPALAPYIKVVTTPVTTAPGEIRIAAVAAFETLPLADGEVVEDAEQIVNLGLRWAVTDATTAAYDGYFRHRTVEPFASRRTTLSNGLTLSHIFSPRFFGNARLLRTDTSEANRDDSVDHSYSASLRADYFDTLHQTFVYSGRHSDRDGDVSYSNGVFLRTDADLYQGWSANLDVGYSLLHPREEPDSGIATMRVATNVIPNPTLNFSVDYLISVNNEKGRSTRIDQNARFQGIWVPLRTLSFFASVRLRHKKTEDEGLKIAQDYSVNWAPFPDGTLNLSFSYNDNIDTEGNETRAFSPELNWQFMRNTVLNVRFNIGTIETDRETRDLKNVRAMIRTFY